jgi:hypothetical protein
MVILESCSQFKQEQFYHYVPVKEPRIAVTIVEEESEVEEPAVLEDYLVLDEVTSESEEVTETTEPLIPQVFDSHFHLDRSSRAVWGKSHGHSVEELIEYSFSKEVSYRPSIKVEVVGGVIVYSEPRMYPEVDFTMHRPWKVAVGVHPQAL